MAKDVPRGERERHCLFLQCPRGPLMALVARHAGAPWGTGVYPHGPQLDVVDRSRVRKETPGEIFGRVRSEDPSADEMSQRGSLDFARERG